MPVDFDLPVAAGSGMPSFQVFHHIFITAPDRQLEIIDDKNPDPGLNKKVESLFRKTPPSSAS